MCILSIYIYLCVLSFQFSLLALPCHRMLACLPILCTYTRRVSYTSSVKKHTAHTHTTTPISLVVCINLFRLLFISFYYNYYSVLCCCCCCFVEISTFLVVVLVFCVCLCVCVSLFVCLFACFEF